MTVAFIGFGEAGSAFARGWGAARPETAAYDVKMEDAAARGEIEARCEAHGVGCARSAEEALTGAEAVFCTVTADRALEAARACAPHLAPGALWLDCNSCAPGTKREAAGVIEAASARYVDVAVMAPVHPKLHHVPLLVGGPHAEAAREALEALDMRPVVAGGEVGQASTIKMLRSVMIKGMEAVAAECFLSARRAGVEEAVLASLDASDPALGWARRGAYNLERMCAHGARRAAEMREVALTVSDLGLGGEMSAASALWQDRMAGAARVSETDDLWEIADAVLKSLEGR